MLGLQGAVITMSNGGHAYVDQMLLCQQLEQAGVATVLGVDEYSDIDGRDFPLVTYVPEARAIVSVGNQEQIVEWPAVERVLGGTRFLAGNLQEKGIFARARRAAPGRAQGRSTAPRISSAGPRYAAEPTEEAVQWRTGSRTT